MWFEAKRGSGSASDNRVPAVDVNLRPGHECGSGREIERQRLQFIDLPNPVHGDHFLDQTLARFGLEETRIEIGQKNSRDTSR